MRLIRLIAFLIALVASLPAFSQTDPNVVKVDSSMRRPGTKPDIPDSIPSKVTTKEKEVFKDSTRLALELLPRASAMRSLFVPGLGQIHNKQYWKLPFVYGGYVTLALIYNFEQQNYRQTLHELQYRLLHDRQPNDPRLVNVSFENVVAAKDYYRRNRDLCILGFLVWHGVQTLDALVAAKMFRYDVTPDVVLRIEPALQPGILTSALPSPGLRLNVTF